MVLSRFMLHTEFARHMAKHHQLKDTPLRRIETFILALRARKNDQRYFSRAYVRAFIDYSQHIRPTERLASDFSRLVQTKELMKKEKDTFQVEVNQLQKSETGLTAETLAAFMGVGSSRVKTWKQQGYITHINKPDGGEVIDLNNFFSHFFWTL